MLNDALTIARPLGFVLLSLIGGGCVRSDLATAHPELADVVTSYYSSQMEKDWSQTYDLRMPEFRNMVERSYYIQQMAEDSKGWQMRGFEIESFEQQDDLISIVMRFQYVVGDTDVRKSVEFLDKTAWVEIDGRWFSHNAGVQRHLPLNDSIVR